MDRENESHDPLLTKSLITRIRSQHRDTSATSIHSTFYRNLENALDQRCATHSFRCAVQTDWQLNVDKVDFASNDIFSWNSSGVLRAAFLRQLELYPRFNLGSGGSRLLDGHYPYIEEAENEIAAFHGAETGLILGSGFDANLAVWSAIVRPGDIILYDALVHASTHEGIAQSVALRKIEFPHNNVRAFCDSLRLILDTEALVRQGRRSVLVAVEGVYSMDGDVCLLQELVDAAEEMSQGQGNVQFVIDEAHSTGLLGPKGAGLVSALGLERHVAVRVHTFGKCMGSTGAIVLGNATVKAVLLNFARATMFSTSPSFPLVAAIKAGYGLLQGASGLQVQNRVQHVIRLFYKNITSHPRWHEARDRGLLSVPLADDWESRPFLSHITTLWTRPCHIFWLYFHLLSVGFCVWPVDHPVVPIGQGRIKISFHAGNTDTQVVGLVDGIMTWVDEMIAIEDGCSKERVTLAAKKVYNWMRAEGLDGFGIM